MSVFSCGYTSSASYHPYGLIYPPFHIGLPFFWLTSMPKAFNLLRVVVVFQPAKENIISVYPSSHSYTSQMRFSFRYTHTIVTVSFFTTLTSVFPLFQLFCAFTASHIAFSILFITQYPISVSGTTFKIIE